MSLLLLLQNVINTSLKACLYRTILIRCLYRTILIRCLYRTILIRCLYRTILIRCLYRTILIRWCALLDLSIISIPVKVAPLSGYYIQQRLGIHLEQNRSQNGTLGYSIHKGARSWRNTINHNKLATITDI